MHTGASGIRMLEGPIPFMSPVVGSCILAAMAAVLFLLMEPETSRYRKTMISFLVGMRDSSSLVSRHVQRINERIASRLSFPVGLVLGIELVSLSALAATAMQIDEYFAAYFLWLIVTVAWTTKALAWKGFRSQFWTWTGRASHALTALAVCMAMIMITKIREGDKP